MFVADEISIELRRVVDFMNRQIDSAEVLAGEIKQYVGGESKVLVPRVMGQTGRRSGRNPVPQITLSEEGSLPRVLPASHRLAARARLHQSKDGTATELVYIRSGAGASEHSLRRSLCSRWTGPDGNLHRPWRCCHQQTVVRQACLRTKVPGKQVRRRVELGEVRRTQSMPGSGIPSRQHRGRSADLGSG